LIKIVALQCIGLPREFCASWYEVNWMRLKSHLVQKDFGRLLHQTLMKFCGASMAIGASVGLVGFSRVFEDQLLGIAMLAGLTAGAFPAWRGARLSPV
jgi:hypothetical protein